MDRQPKDRSQRFDAIFAIVKLPNVSASKKPKITAAVCIVPSRYRSRTRAYVFTSPVCLSIMASLPDVLAPMAPRSSPNQPHGLQPASEFTADSNQPTPLHSRPAQTHPPSPQHSLCCSKRETPSGRSPLARLLLLACEDPLAVGRARGSIMALT